jgi:hypothetical protein
VSLQNTIHPDDESRCLIIIIIIIRGDLKPETEIEIVAAV